MSNFESENLNIECYIIPNSSHIISTVYYPHSRANTLLPSTVFLCISPSFLYSPVHFSVVFSALLEGGDEAQRIPFDSALSESSESTYDTVLNEFRCTVPGSYFFTFTYVYPYPSGYLLHLDREWQMQVNALSTRPVVNGHQCLSGPIVYLSLTE